MSLRLLEAVAQEEIASEDRRSIPGAKFLAAG
jgi:hypothetical protein